MGFVWGSPMDGVAIAMVDRTVGVIPCTQTIPLHEAMARRTLTNGGDVFIVSFH